MKADLVKIERQYDEDQQAAEEDTARQSGKQRHQPTQAELLVALAKDGVFVHDANGDAYVRFEVAEHRETHPVRSKAFRRRLTKAFLDSEGKPPNRQALETAINAVEAIAHFDSPEERVFTRVGRRGERIYLDLADRYWRVVEISANGWRVCRESPVWFRRAPGMLALPEPEPGGSLADLRPFLNVEHDDDLVLIVAWLVVALHDAGPYPVLVLCGEQGSAKSTAVRVLRRLVDPNSAALRSPPREERDLAIAARNAWLVALDNVSGLPDWLSDGLCRIATGGGFSTRQLYSDADEMLFDTMRPIVINGIEDPVERDDLRDRALFWTLPTISVQQRRTERDFWRDFGAAAPRILAHLLDGVAAALRRYDAAVLPGAPRMADFCQRAVAAEEALGFTPGTFLRVYEENRENAIERQVEDSRLATELRAIAAEGKWEGTASDLLAKLNSRVGDEIQRRRWWPKSPRSLSGQVRRAAPGLRQIGVEITFDREPGGATGKRRRLISVEVGAKYRPYRPDAAVEHDGQASERPSPSRHRPSNHDQGDGGDGRDGVVRPLDDALDPDAEARAAMREGA